MGAAVVWRPMESMVSIGAACLWAEKPLGGCVCGGPGPGMADGSYRIGGRVLSAGFWGQGQACPFGQRPVLEPFAASELC